MSADVVRAGPWTARWASQTGAAHRARGLGNEDAAAAAALPAPHEGIVAALADGHGGAQHVRAHVGARLAVDVACSTLVELLPDELQRGSDMAEYARRVLSPVLVSRWSAAAEAHLAEHPFTRAESGRAPDPLEAAPLVAYGTTLVVTACWSLGMLAMQLGDGDIVVVTGDGRTSQPVARDARLAGDATTSLCLPHAASHFHIGPVRTVDDVALVLLASDGYGNSFVDADWRRVVGQDFLSLLEADGAERVAAALPSWLAESADVGGDDVTLLMLLHEIA